MPSEKTLFFIVLFVIANALNAQESGPATDTIFRFPVLYFGDQLENKTYYTGIDGRFVLSFANDSVVQARFFSVDRFQRYQKIHYHTNGDTVFLHNTDQVRFTYSLCKSKDVKKIYSKKSIPVIVKFFCPKQFVMKKGVQEQYLMHEGIYYMDPDSLQLYIPYDDCQYANIIIVNHIDYYARLCKDMDTSVYPSYDYLKIDLTNRYSLCQKALFNEFPLMIKGDSIFPVDNEKNYQCWIDNGFFFPIMIKGHDKPWEARDIPYRRVGLEGTKFEY